MFPEKCNSSDKFEEGQQSERQQNKKQQNERRSKMSKKYQNRLNLVNVNTDVTTEVTTEVSTDVASTLVTLSCAPKKIEKEKDISKRGRLISVSLQFKINNNRTHRSVFRNNNTIEEANAWEIQWPGGFDESSKRYIKLTTAKGGYKNSRDAITEGRKAKKAIEEALKDGIVDPGEIRKIAKEACIEKD